MATILEKRRWGGFATKLQLAARLVEWIVPLLKNAGKTVWVVNDGGYTKRPFAKRALKTGVTIVGRLRKDAALRDLPPKLKKGQQQVRNIWTNLAVYNLNLWMHSFVELWSWNRSHKQLCDRSDSPWDDVARRPSHANKRKALRQQILHKEFSTLRAGGRLP